jgi:hypothetical protein
MMPDERDEADADEQPGGVINDPVSAAFAGVMAAIIESTPSGTVRAQAVTATMEAHAAVKVLLARSRLN